MKCLKNTCFLSLLTLFSVAPVFEVVADGISGTGGRAVGGAGRFGSIVIGGVHYETESAVIRINGERAFEHDIRVGNRLTIRGDLDTRQAWSVDYFDAVAGPVETVAIDDPLLGSAELQVMGQRVVTNSATWLYGTTLETLVPGQPLAVSGARMPDGSVLASSIEAVARHREVVSGVVRAVTGDGFFIDALFIQADEDLPSVATGQRVHVIGDYQGLDGLRAAEILPMGEAGVENEDAIIHGPLSFGPQGWFLEGYRLEIDAQARLVNGGHGELAVGAQVAVRGTLTPAGVLQVSGLEFQRDALSRLDGVIESVDEQHGTVTIDGVEVHVDEDVSMRDDRDNYRWFAPEDLAAHDAISVMVEERNGRLVAKRVTRRSDLRRVLRSRIEAASWLGRATAMHRQLDDLGSARSAQLNGVRVSPRILRWLVRDGDEIALEWNASGELETVRVETSGAPFATKISR